VLGERVGRDSRRIVVVAERDAAGEGTTARLSATAALLELARVYRGRHDAPDADLGLHERRARAAWPACGPGRRLGGPVDAVLVLGDVASRRSAARSDPRGRRAPARRRCACGARSRRRCGSRRASTRARAGAAAAQPPGRAADPDPQGPLAADGLSAVTLQASGERGPEPGAAASRARLQAFGRATLRSISALDNGPDVPAGPREYLLFRRQVVPRWAVALLAGALLLPALLGAIDGLARVRRRKQPVAVWLRWLAAGALPFVLTALAARLLGSPASCRRWPGASTPPRCRSTPRCSPSSASCSSWASCCARPPRGRSAHRRRRATRTSRAPRPPWRWCWSPSPWRSGSSTRTPRCCWRPPST
jgi:hypothetical protein